MSSRDKNSSQQPEENRINLKGRILLTAKIIIFTALITSAITVVATVVVLQRLGLIARNFSSLSNSPVIPPVSSNPSNSPTISPVSSNPSNSPTISPVSPNPSNSPPNPSPAPTVLYIATKCISDTPGIDINGILHNPNNSTITIGKEFVTEIANISGYYNVLSQSQPLEFICPLNSSYKKLRLVFGVNDVNNLSQPSNKIQMEVLLDSKSAAIRQVTVGTKQTLELDVQGMKTVALRVGCTSTCPPLSFTDMELK